MADVGSDRGQLILVTGLMVAVAMVALVLLLNTSIYTENLASRGIDESGREVVEFRAEAVDGVGGLIDEENAANTNAHSDLRTRIRDGIDRFDGLTARRYASGGSSASINDSTATFTNGWTIQQTDPSRSLTNKTGTGEWSLVSGVTKARAFTVTLDTSNLTTTSAGSARSSAFTVNVSNGARWETFVYNNSTTGELAVATATGGGTPVEVCSTSATPATLDLTGGTLNGQECPGLVWAEGVGSGYDIRYVNGVNGNGTYSLTLDSLQPDDDNLNDRFSPASPYFAPAVYSVTLELRFESPTVTYEGTVVVAPGEPP